MIAQRLVDIASSWIDLLVAQSVNAALIFVAALVAARLLRRRSPAVHLALWSLVFVRLLLPPSLTHPWSLGAVLDHIVGSPLTVVSHPIGGVGSDAVGHAMTQVAGARVAAIDRVKQGLGVLWLIGTVIALVAYRRRLAPFRRQIRDARCVADPEILELTDRWRSRLGVRRRVRVVTSSARLSPFTTGLVRPLIFLPQSVLTDRRTVEPAVAHEMAHVARLDALWLGLQHLIQAVYFFHPLVWISGARLEIERERLCDATVLAFGRISARRYVGGLLNVLQLDLQGAGAPTMTARQRRIDVRIRSILERDGAPSPRLLLAFAVVSFLGVFLLPLGRSGASAKSDDSGTQSPAIVQIASSDAAPGFENPLPDGRITWTWGPEKRDPWTGEKVFHRGIDVAATSGTPVLAPADGVVVVATEDYEESPRSGTVIVVEHGDGWTTFYSHLESLKVSEGQRVARREVIATVGTTGKSSGPHLHFEIRHNGESLDPASFVTDWN